MPERRFFCRRGEAEGRKASAGQRTRVGRNVAAAAKSAWESGRGRGGCLLSRGSAKGAGRGALPWEPGRRFSGRRSAGDTVQAGRRGRTSVDIENWGPSMAGGGRNRAASGEKSVRRHGLRRMQGGNIQDEAASAPRSSVRRKSGYHGACRRGGASCAKKERAWAFW